MLAAVQPFVSGSVSKTIHIPATATIADVRDAYLYAWNRRQRRALPRRLEAEPAARRRHQRSRWLRERVTAFASPVQIAEKIVYRYLARQRKLPNKRGGYTQNFKIGGQKFYMRTGEYAMLRLAKSS